MRRWGFTLIELLIVVAIIGILARISHTPPQKRVEMERMGKRDPKCWGSDEKSLPERAEREGQPQKWA